MGILIDSSVFIDYERGRLDLAEVVDGREEEEIYLSVITASELLHGIHRTGDRTIRARRSALVEALLAEFPVLPVDILTARTHSELWAHLASTGRPIGAHDLWLAATCIARGLTLATGNAREFGKIPELSIEVWRPSE